MALLANYSVDTSALMDGWIRRYPLATFPRLWERIDELVDAGRFKVSEEVVDDVKHHDDSLTKWVVDREARLVIPTDDAVVAEVRTILTAHGKLVKSGTGRSRSDPFVIAVACLNNATVVTGEKGGTPDRPRIPSVCAALTVPLACIDFLGLIQAEGWVF